MEAKIKHALEIKLNEADYRPDLKKKTLGYATAREAKTDNSPLKLRYISLITFSCVVFMIIFVNQSFGRPTIPKQISQVTPNVFENHSDFNFANVLEELNLNYQEQLTMIENGVSVTFYTIEGITTHTVNFKRIEPSADICQEIRDIGILEKSFSLLQLSDGYFLAYKELNHALFTHLYTEDNAIKCP